MPTPNSNPATGLQRGADSSARGMTCDAHDLKRILTLLADQVADADRRHSDALSCMQQRLAQLDTTARDLKSQLPQEMSPVLDRIQGGMAALSDQITEQSAQRQQAIATYEAPAVPEVESAPALRSAMAADALDAYARRTQATRNATNKNVDHFDVVESERTPRMDPAHVDRTHADHIWNESAVEALARHFDAPSVSATETAPESTAAGMHSAMIEALTAAPIRTTPPAIVLTAAAVHPYPASTAPAAPARNNAHSNSAAADFATLHAMAMTNEREWLEGRFSAIAGRLETSLKDIGSNGALATIDARFSQLETKLTQALSSASKAPDMSGLKGIENQVEDLSAQLSSVQNHFSRLDTIELELRSLADRFKSDKMTRLLENAGDRAPDSDAIAGAVASRVAQEMPRLEQKLQSLTESLSAEKLAGILAKAAPSAPDAGTIARLVAEHVTQSMPKQSEQSSAAPKLDELRSMIEAFVVEQREGGEQTASMLDTMQQAMISLLDRLDAIEQGTLGPADADATSGHSSGDSDHHGYEQQAAGYDTPAARRNDTTHTPAHVIDDEQAAAPAYHQPVQAGTHAVRTAPRPSIVYSDAGTATEPPAANHRDDFISAARRAARMANEAPADETVELDDVAQTRPGIAQKVRRQPETAKPRRPLSRVSMALLCLVAVGASFAVVKSTILAPSHIIPAGTPAAAPAPKAAPLSKNPADKSLQQLDDADVIIDDDKKGTVPAPRRSSIEGGDGGVHDRDFASAFAGGTRSAIPASQIQSQGEFTPAMSEFARQNLSGATSVPASLTPDRPAGAMAKSNDNLPLTIGPNSLRAAALKGDSSAEFEIGARFAEGRGAPQDLEQAITWYQKSAAQSFAPAQYRLGSMYERGLGVKTDLARARVWYQRAAEQGIVKAMHNLAVLTAGRDANATDYEAASKWFKAAADHGLTDSQFNLAIMHDSGLGMSKDLKQAFKWFSLAARSGDEEASRRRESLRTKLMPQELAEVEAELAQWRPKSTDQSVNDPRMAGEGWKQRAR
jgi:localization factor PodJL